MVPDQRIAEEDEGIQRPLDGPGKHDYGFLSDYGESHAPAPLPLDAVHEDFRRTSEACYRRVDNVWLSHRRACESEDDVCLRQGVSKRSRQRLPLIGDDPDIDRLPAGLI